MKWLASLLAKNAFGAIAGSEFDVEEAETIRGRVCESFVHKLCMRRLITTLRLRLIVSNVDRNS